MNGKSLSAVTLILFSFIVSFLCTTPALAMLRVMKYRPMTEIKRSSLCIYAKHEVNRKAENQASLMNGSAPIACRLTVSAEAEKPALTKLGSGSKETRTLISSTISSYQFNRLTRSCVEFENVIEPGEKIVELKSLQTECSLLSAAPRVFPDWRPGPASPVQPKIMDPKTSKQLARNKL